MTRFKYDVSSEGTAECKGLVSLGVIFFDVQRLHLPSKSLSLSSFNATVTVITFVQKFKARLVVVISK